MAIKKGEDILKKVSNLIDSFQEKLFEISKEYYQDVGFTLCQLISISDTIAIFTPKVSSVSIHQLLELNARLSAYILKSCVENFFPIRGAITYGQYNTLKNIMIGPGIDECASWHETGNWIGVHLTPSAKMNYIDSSQYKDDCPYICSYNKIPLKPGLSSDMCVKWEIDEQVYKKFVLNNSPLLPEISSKYTNTHSFLKEIVWKSGDNNAKN